MTTTQDLNRTAQRHQAHVDHRAAELGWARVTGALRYNGCPRRLLRKHCRNGAALDDACWCCSRLNDHADTWRDSSGRRFVLWEPYGADGDELANVIAAARRDGLRVWISVSVWNPPTTVGIRFEVDR